MAKKYKKKIRVSTRIEKQWNAVKKVFPGCIGTYPDCPKEIPDKNAPPTQCRTCPVYLQE